MKLEHRDTKARSFLVLFLEKYFSLCLRVSVFNISQTSMLLPIRPYARYDKRMDSGIERDGKALVGRGGSSIGAPVDGIDAHYIVAE